MRTLVNDEIDVPDHMTNGHFPTSTLRLREIDGARMILEQLWESEMDGWVDDIWVPIKSVAS